MSVLRPAETDLHLHAQTCARNVVSSVQVLSTAGWEAHLRRLERALENVERNVPEHLSRSTMETALRAELEVARAALSFSRRLDALRFSSAEVTATLPSLKMQA